MEDSIGNFVRQDETSKRFESFISQNNLDRSVFCPTSSFDPSHITECPRRMIYRARGISPDRIPESYMDSMGDLFARKKWIEILSKFKTFRMIDKSVVAADCHYNISGNIDAILNIGEKIYVTKIQPLTQEEFLEVKEKGAFKKHVVELIVYIWLTETNDGLLLYDNQNATEYMSFHVIAYPPVIKSIMKKCLILMDHKIQGTIPERPYKSKKSQECVGCEFSLNCWQEKNSNDKK